MCAKEIQNDPNLAKMEKLDVLRAYTDSVTLTLLLTNYSDLLIISALIN